MRRLGGLVLILGCLSTTASADVEGKLAAYEREVLQLGSELPKPGELGARGPRRLVDAQVAFSMGNYDEAALALFELASKPGPDQEAATYYLAEALFAKGERGAARNYYETISSNQNGRYYQSSLLRQIEIAIALADSSNLANVIAAVDRLAPGVRKPEVVYVRGKYAFSEGKYDEALAYFNDVPKGSDYEAQAAYYSATVYVAKKDLARAVDIYTGLTNLKSKRPNDRRIVELSHMALGRLNYERDQPSRAIDSYLEIDRHSDLFPDALYEVAWVYVKGKQYDKALRALELLALSEPTSNKTPTVRILEGNLRIRKAQMVRTAQVSGTIDDTTKGLEPSVEYDKAEAVFTDTHDTYLPSYLALSEMAEAQDAGQDPGQYLWQLAGRSPRAFEVSQPVPEAAAQYLREVPDVQRIVTVATDLKTAEADIATSEAILTRLEAMIATGDRTAVYPKLQTRRLRLGQIQDDVIKIRIDLLDRAGGTDPNLTSSRKQLAQAYFALGSVERLVADRYSAVSADYDKLEGSVSEAGAIFDSTQAMAVAIRHFAHDPRATGKEPLPKDQRATILTSLDETAKEAADIEKELTDLQRELQLGRDLTSVGDEQVIKARDLRKQLVAALDAEQKSANAGGNAKLVGLGQRAMLVSTNLNQIDGQLDTLVDQGMAQVKTQIETERQNIVTMRSELAEYETESRTIGGTVLGGSFKDVKAKFYDIVIRTDVGNVDVAWSRKEDNDDDLKRLNLSRQRDLKQLRDEFRGIIEENTKSPAKAPAPSSKPDEAKPQTSPDKGGTDSRVSPGSGDPKQPAAPTVRPDNEQGKPAPKPGTPAKPAGSKP